VSSSTTYYLVVVLDASDDTDPGDNEGSRAAVTVDPADVDYTVDVVDPTADTTAGQSFSNARFKFRNDGTFAGAQPVFWNAYVSTDAVFDAGDILVDSGSASALSGGATSPNVTFDGVWPSTPGPYYLVVTLSASDDVNSANDEGALAAPQVTTAPDVDYEVTVVNDTSATSYAGDGLTGELRFGNIGTDDGSLTVFWTAYLSSDAVLDGADTVIDSGTSAALAKSANSGMIPFSGTWPALTGDWYLIVDVYAADDVVSPSWLASAATTVTTPPPPDYTPTLLDYPWVDLVTTTIDGAPDPSIRIDNVAANDGIQPVNWAVYRSLDRMLDGGDVQIASSSDPPILAGGNAVSPFNAAWPAAGDIFYLIATVSAADDPNISNNTHVSHPIAVADATYGTGVGEENEPNNGEFGAPPASPPPPLALPPWDCEVTGLALAAGGTIALYATMDAYNNFDTFEWQAGPAMSEVRIVSAWDTGWDDMDVYQWTSTGSGFDSIDTSANREPSTGAFGLSGLVPGNLYYTGAYFWLEGDTSGSAGQPYVLLLKGGP
jgi:hypothetical protein